MADETPESEYDPPPGWLDNEFTSLMEDAHRNRWATFYNLKTESTRLARIDNIFRQISRDWRDPKQDRLSCDLFLRAHSAFFASCTLVFGGQLSEAYPLARLSLEYSASSLIIHQERALVKVFLGRHENDGGASMKASKTAFGAAAFKKAVLTEDPGLGKRFAEIYEHTIHFGAHPNPLAVVPSTAVRGNKHGQLFLHSDPSSIKQALLRVWHVGACALDVLAIVFPDRFNLIVADSAGPGGAPAP